MTPAGIKTAMVRVPAGSFEMGSNDDEGEQPVHVVTADSFLMDVTEATVRDYEACVRKGMCSPAESGQYCNSGKIDRRDHPINCVDWHQATAFCAWLGKRLPTDEEWEYAARGTDGRTYPWGMESPDKQLCWKAVGTCRVGQFPSGRSPFGVLDLAGNVDEWTSDGHSKDYLEPRAKDRRIVRGTAYHTRDPHYVRATYRGEAADTHSLSYLGFRCVRSVL